MPRMRRIHRTKIVMSPGVISTGKTAGSKALTYMMLAGLMCNHQGMNKQYCDLRTDHEGQHSRKYWNRCQRKNFREYWSDAKAG